MRPILVATLLVMLFNSSCGGPPTLSWNGYGKVMFGRPLAEAEARMGEKALPEVRDAACAFVSFPSYPGIEFMVEEGVVTRADAGPDVINSLGIAVGTEFAEVRRKHPEVEIHGHAYVPDGHNLVFRSRDGDKAIVAEEADGRITSIRAGIQPSVGYIEGCL
ncbi:MAG: hypothetical protein AB1568_15070 [Thermodesulfobacteriota bacterium]